MSKNLVIVESPAKAKTIEGFLGDGFIVKSSSGSVEVFDHDNIKDYRIARSHIGLVPQELTTDAFETVWNTAKFSRGLFGKSPSPAYIRELATFM